MAEPVNIGPFQNIVNVGWGKARVVAFIVDVTLSGENQGSPPTVSYDYTISVGGTGGEILRHQQIVNRATATGPAPPISQIVSPAMLAHYAIWSYPPYELDDAVGHSSGGGFYFINSDGGVFPDFVPSPYGSVLAAENYLDAQAIIHPEYNGQTFFITFQPPFDTYSQTKHFRQITFINMAAFAKDGTGKVSIGFTAQGSPGGDGNLQVFVGLFRGSPLLFTVGPHLEDFFGSGADATYSYTANDPDILETLTGTILVHPENPPSITGPDSPGGGGEG